MPRLCECVALGLAVVRQCSGSKPCSLPVGSALLPEHATSQERRLMSEFVHAFGLADFADVPALDPPAWPPGCFLSGQPEPPLLPS